MPKIAIDAYYRGSMSQLVKAVRPIRGWIRATRSELGLTGVQLAQKMGVQPPRVVEIEKGELAGVLTLNTLERAAEAMGYQFVYAMVPKRAPTLTAPSTSVADSISLSELEKSGLRQSHIKTRNDLRRWEEESIRLAEAWARKKKPRNVLSEKFFLQLHQRMFGTVWKGCGTFRTDAEVETSILPVGFHAVPKPADIAGKVGSLFQNAKYWNSSSTYSAVEAGARFYHRLLVIHPFSKGSHSISRLMTDLMLIHLYKHPPFTWGAQACVEGEPGDAEIKALRAAQGRNYGPLIEWARTGSVKV